MLHIDRVRQLDGDLHRIGLAASVVKRGGGKPRAERQLRRNQGGRTSRRGSRRGCGGGSFRECRCVCDHRGRGHRRRGGDRVGRRADDKGHLVVFAPGIRSGLGAHLQRVLASRGW